LDLTRTGTRRKRVVDEEADFAAGSGGEDANETNSTGGLSEEMMPCSSREPPKETSETVFKLETQSGH